MSNSYQKVFIDQLKSDFHCAALPPSMENLAKERFKPNTVIILADFIIYLFLRCVRSYSSSVIFLFCLSACTVFKM